MVTWRKASSTPSLAIMRLARARTSLAWASVSGTGISSSIFFAFTRLLARRPARRRQFEALERKAWRDRAPDQGPVAQTFGCLPGPHRHDHLRDFIGMN